MKKFFLKITLSAMLGGLPAMSMAAIEIIDQDAQATVISQTTNNTLHIVNANGGVVYIYNVGWQVYQDLQGGRPRPPVRTQSSERNLYRKSR